MVQFLHCLSCFPSSFPRQSALPLCHIYPLQWTISLSNNLKKEIPLLVKSFNLHLIQMYKKKCAYWRLRSLRQHPCPRVWPFEVDRLWPPDKALSYHKLHLPFHFFVFLQTSQEVFFFQPNTSPNERSLSHGSGLFYEATFLQTRFLSVLCSVLFF